jgi:hypothetical protein
MTSLLDALHLPVQTTQPAAWQPASQLPPALALRQLLFGHRVTRIITVAVQLGLIDQMDETPRTVTTLAAAVGANAAALHRLLWGLASVGLVTAAEPDAFALTPMGACLRTDAPRSLRSWVLMESADYYQAAWDHLLDGVRSGTPAFDCAVGQPFYHYLDRHPTDGRNFSQTMGEVTAVIVDAVLAAYDFSSYRRVVDVGGGYGKLLTTLLHHYPTMQGVLFDTPTVIERAKAQIQATSVAQCCSCAIVGRQWPRVGAFTSFNCCCPRPRRMRPVTSSLTGPCPTSICLCWVLAPNAPRRSIGRCWPAPALP